MPLEVAQIRRRVQVRLADLKKVAATRRDRVVAAEKAYETFLSSLALPTLTTFAQALSAEAYPYRVLTPGGSVRLSSDRSNKTYVELRLDTSARVPSIVGEISRERGHRLVTEERVLAGGTPLEEITDEMLVEFVLEAMADLIER